MELAVHPNELLVLYNGNSPVDKKVIAFAQTLTKNIREVKYSEANFPDTIWKEVLRMLQCHPKELLDKSHPEYQAKIRGHEYTSDGWLKVLSHNPHLIKGPIVIKNGEAILCMRPKDVLKINKG